ncbi:MAG: hypothetical protein UV27_C0022G0012 [candidate division WWE3 bacterium GW2011_GWA1_42_46]|nr:MAG: hypothetical protein UV27_C0022G0012 [candidate division WWE3 bacterium GW2011_GWA1_42_46]
MGNARIVDINPETTTRNKPTIKLMVKGEDMITLQWRVVYVKGCGDRGEECLEVTGRDFSTVFSAYSHFLGPVESEGTVANEPVYST